MHASSSPAVILIVVVVLGYCDGKKGRSPRPLITFIPLLGGQLATNLEMALLLPAAALGHRRAKLPVNRDAGHQLMVFKNIKKGGLYSEPFASPF